MNNYKSIVLSLFLLAIIVFSVVASDSPQRATKNKDGLDELRTELIKGVPGRMVRVAGGLFEMGATQEQKSDLYTLSNELPTRKVTLSTFFIGRFEVTQAEFKAVMGYNPSVEEFGIGDLLPVNNVALYDIQRFITKLNKISGLDYRLPTEAEWEYAARGGAKSKGYKYSGSDDCFEVGWVMDNSNKGVHQVGSKRANELGLFDMTGNVKEWCEDIYDSYGNMKKDLVDPIGGTGSGKKRIIRGGSFDDYVINSRLSCRFGRDIGYYAPSIGFRLALSLEHKENKDEITEDDLLE